jgi:hypothetical protein
MTVSSSAAWLRRFSGFGWAGLLDFCRWLTTARSLDLDVSGGAYIHRHGQRNWRHAAIASIRSQ